MMSEHAYAVLEAVTWLEVLNPKEHVEASETIAGHAKFFSASGAPTGTETRVRKVLGRDGKEHTRRYLVPLPPHLERWNHSLITAGQADLASLIERQFRDLEQKLTRWRASCAETIEQWRWDNQLICMGELPDNLRAVIGDHLCDDLDEITYSAATLSRLIEQVIDQQGGGNSSGDGESDSWALALNCLSGNQIAIVEAIKASDGGLSYEEITEVPGAFVDQYPTPSNARTQVTRIRAAWEKGAAGYEIPRPKRGGKLTVRAINPGKT